MATFTGNILEDETTDINIEDGKITFIYPNGKTRTVRIMDAIIYNNGRFLEVAPTAKLEPARFVNANDIQAIESIAVEYSNTYLETLESVSTMFTNGGDIRTAVVESNNKSIGVKKGDIIKIVKSIFAVKPFYIKKVTSKASFDRAKNVQRLDDYTMRIYTKSGRLFDIELTEDVKEEFMEAVERVMA